MDPVEPRCGYVHRLLSVGSFAAFAPVFRGKLSATLSLPLIVFVCAFFQEKLKKITVFGAGLLVGTALAVIIPEGVRSLVVEGAPHVNTVVANAGATQAHEEGNALSVIGYCLVLGFIFMLVVDQVSHGRNNKSPRFCFLVHFFLFWRDFKSWIK